MGLKFVSVAAVAALGLVGIAQAQGPAPAPASAPATGYLGKSALPDTFRILPPAPVEGSVRAEADRQVFQATRKLKDSDRWRLAAADDVGLTHAMSCAVGVEISPQATPKLAAMVRRVTRDSSDATNHAKDLNKRRRPFLIDQGSICVEDKRAGLATSFDYPSGHTTAGWTVGLILAELAPDKATDILIRARSYGESRLICGVHNSSAVDQGRTNGSIVVAALHGSKEFRDDLEAVRAELAAARKSGPAPDPKACAVEAALAEKTPF